MNTNDGGPAFPRPATDNLLDGDGSCGMSLRDWFAGQAIPTLVRLEIETMRQHGEETGFDDSPWLDSSTTYAEDLAEQAYVIADAMIAARQNGGDA